MKENLEVKNYGNIRGGANCNARFFLHVCPPEEFTKEEYFAIFRLWDEEFGMKGANWDGWYYPINTRREFAVVPAIIRKAQKLGYDCKTSLWDVGEGEYSLQNNPAEFFQVLAMAQAFYRD